MSEPGRRWTAVSASVRGSSHERSGTPNQDAVRIVEVDAPVAGLVAAVCDGHGSARYVRSEVGARIGVEVACLVGRRALRDLGSTPDAATVEAALTGPIATEIVGQWRQRVIDDVNQRPFTPDERTRAGAALDDDPHVSYGCTLLLAVHGPTWVGLLQIGDGDVTAVNGTRTESPVPGDDRLIGNQTTSLCLSTAVADARVRALVEPLPELMILTSDGYANSFASASWRSEVGGDLRDHVWRVGLEEVGSKLPAWLFDSAAAGGDDVTMALVVRVDAVGRADAGSDEAVGHASIEPAWAPIRRRRRALVALAFLLAIVAGGATGWALAQIDRASNPSPDIGDRETSTDGTGQLDATPGHSPDLAPSVTTTPSPSTTDAPPTTTSSPPTTTESIATNPSVSENIIPPRLTADQQIHLAVGSRRGLVLAFDSSKPDQDTAYGFGWAALDQESPSVPLGWGFEHVPGEEFVQLEAPDGATHRASAVVTSDRYVWAVSEDHERLNAFDIESGEWRGTVPITEYPSDAARPVVATPGDVEG